MDERRGGLASKTAQSELTTGAAAAPKRRATVAICASTLAIIAAVLFVAVAAFSATAAVVEVGRQVFTRATAAGRTARTHVTTTAAVSFIAPHVHARAIAAGLVGAAARITRANATSSAARAVARAREVARTAVLIRRGKVRFTAGVGTSVAISEAGAAATDLAAAAVAATGCVRQVAGLVALAAVLERVQPLLTPVLFEARIAVAITRRARRQRAFPIRAARRRVRVRTRLAALPAIARGLNVRLAAVRERVVAVFETTSTRGGALASCTGRCCI
jgi:hypothetical protein